MAQIPKGLRDEFAMAALTGLVSRSYYDPVTGDSQQYCNAYTLAKHAYEHADAMLVERERL